MSEATAFAALAVQHKLLKPADPRSLSEIEAHYRGLAQPVAALQAAATDELLREVARLADMINAARDLAETWGHLPHEDMIEQIDAHLESTFPDASEDDRAVAIEEALQS